MGVGVQEFGICGESIICFAGEDWWYHHPHSKNHILKRLAKENKVLFINSITMGLPAASNPDFLPKIYRKFKSMLRWLRWTPEGIWVMTPISIPVYSFAFTRWLNRVLLLTQVKSVQFLLGMRRAIVWVAIPSAAELVEGMGSKLLLYQVSDKYEANQDSATAASLIREWDVCLKHRAAVVMYSGRKLYEESSERHRYFLEQAVDFDHFAVQSDMLAPELNAIPRPVLGYIGWMDYVMDGPLIQRVIDLRPDWHWVFIGNKSNLFEVRGPNVHFLGPKPYNQLPRYLRHIDVCVLPWQTTGFTNYGSAIKVKEYLATGKPVVIAPLYEYATVAGVRTYRTVEEFIAQVEDALKNDTPADRKLRQEVVRDATWDARARQVGELITTLLEGNHHCRPTSQEVATTRQA